MLVPVGLREVPTPQAQPCLAFLVPNRFVRTSSSGVGLGLGLGLDEKGR